MVAALAPSPPTTRVRRCTVGAVNRLRELWRALVALREAIDVRFRIVNCTNELVNETTVDEEATPDFS